MDFDQITQEFLEKSIGHPVQSFQIQSARTKPGENFTSIAYEIEVHLDFGQNGTGTSSVNLPRKIHLFLKCYPDNLQRQAFLNSTNLFLRELNVYQIWLPELQNFQKLRCQNSEELKSIQLEVPPFISGQAMDFLNNNYEKCENSEELLGPLDNHLLLLDIKKTYGYEMVSPRAGYSSLKEVQLVITQLANLHATSWALKCHKGGGNLRDEFQFLDDINLFWKPDHLKNLEKMLSVSFENGLRVLEKLLGVENEIFKGAQRIKGKAMDIMCGTFNQDGIHERRLEKHLRIQPQNQEDDQNPEPWSLVIHGDPWSSNTLFLRDPSTGHPLKTMLLDLQIFREACPTIDLAYLLYISTDSAFRAKYLQEILQHYHDQVVHCCAALKVKPYPGFCIEELERRFQRAKLYGYCQTMISLNILLNDGQDIIDMEWIDTKEITSWTKIYKMLIKLKKGRNNVDYVQRILETSREMYEEGVL